MLWFLLQTNFRKGSKNSCYRNAEGNTLWCLVQLPGEETCLSDNKERDTADKVSAPMTAELETHWDDSGKGIGFPGTISGLFSIVKSWKSGRESKHFIPLAPVWNPKQLISQKLRVEVGYQKWERRKGWVKACYCLVSHGWDGARSLDERLRSLLLKHHDTVLHIANRIKESFEYVYHKIWIYQRERHDFYCFSTILCIYVFKHWMVPYKYIQFLYINEKLF